MRITHLVFSQTTTSKLVDERPTRQSMINDAAKRLAVIVGERQCAQPTLSALHSHDGER
jgi:hypothetical protein